MKKNFIHFFLASGLTILVLWLVLKDNFSEVVNLLQHAKVSWVILVLVLVLAGHSLAGLILMVLTRFNQKDYSLFQGIVNALIASFFHGVTPSASGGQLAQIYVFRKQGVKLSEAASILWMDFIVYQATMIVMMLVFLILRFHYFFYHFSSLFVVVIFAFFVNSMILVGLWAIVRFRKAHHWLTTTGINLGVRLRLIKDKEKILDEINQQMNRFALEINHLQSHRRMIIICVLLNACRLMLHYSIPYFSALALNIPVSSAMILDILALSSYVSMMNAFIPLPGASGGTEATFVLMFSTLFGSSLATGCMILWRFATYYMIMLIGGLTFVLFKLFFRYKIE